MGGATTWATAASPRTRDARRAGALARDDAAREGKAFHWRRWMGEMSAPSLTQLGRRTELPASPDDAQLETVPNPHPGTRYLVRFTCPEFTSLCPITGQPDFAHLVIDYVPGRWLVESKSLKLYLFGFRNHGAFHEDCTLT